jgi:catechol 2,3-dioxygenase-like lactoylglutathione lyase family enzyme
LPNDDIVNVRYMVSDVDEAIAFYTTFLGFELLNSAAPAVADVKRGNLRLLLAGPTSSAGRPMPDGAQPGPGGWNRIHFIVDDIDAEVARQRTAGAPFRNDIIEGPGGKQILLQDPSGNVVGALPARSTLSRRRDLAGLLRAHRQQAIRSVAEISHAWPPTAANARSPRRAASTHGLPRPSSTPRGRWSTAGRLGAALSAPVALPLKKGGEIR